MQNLRVPGASPKKMDFDNHTMLAPHQLTPQLDDAG
jgi:hypothetical protein